jgi:hypothetical protein
MSNLNLLTKGMNQALLIIGIIQLLTGLGIPVEPLVKMMYAILFNVTDKFDSRTTSMSLSTSLLVNTELISSRTISSVNVAFVKG